MFHGMEFIEKPVRAWFARLEAPPTIRLGYADSSMACIPFGTR